MSIEKLVIKSRDVQRSLKQPGMWAQLQCLGTWTPCVISMTTLISPYMDPAYFWDCPFVTIMSSACRECNSQGRNLFLPECSVDSDQDSYVGEKPAGCWSPRGNVLGGAGSTSGLKALAKAPRSLHTKPFLMSSGFTALEFQAGS